MSGASTILGAGPARRGAAWFATALAGRLAAERGRLAPWLAVSLGAGVLLYFALPTEPPPGLWWTTPPLLAVALALGTRWPLAGWAAGMAAALALGFAASAWHAARLPELPNLPRTAVVVTGTVTAVDLLAERPGVAGGTARRLTLDGARLGDGAPLAWQLRVRLRTGDPARPVPGDVVGVRALLRAPSPPAYPGGWDYQRAAFFAGLGGSGFALGPAVVTGAGGAPSPLARARATIEARVATVLPGAAGAVAAALLTGSQGAIPAEALQAMRDSGLAHLLSVSGLHIAIVMGVAFAVLRLGLATMPPLALRCDGKVVAALAALMVGGAYTLLTGAAVPMLRSFAMAALATLAILAGRRALTLRALAVAAAAVLLWQPAALLGPSFQMSFAAVLALVAGWDWARPWLRRPGEPAAWWRRAALASAGVVATSVLAAAATAPFGLHHFGRLQLYGVAANAVAVPLTSILVMPAGMAAMVLMPLGLEGLALVPMGWGVEGMLAVARAVAAWPGAARATEPLPAAALLLVTAGLLWLCVWRTGWRLWGVPLIGLGLAGGWWGGQAPDLLVSADARLIGVRAGGAVLVQRASGASALTRESWERLWGGAAAQPLPTEAVVADGAVTCRPSACTVQPTPDQSMAVVLRDAAARPARRGAARREPDVAAEGASLAAEACARAAVVISAEPLRGACAAMVVDRFAVWRDGAHAVWLDAAGARVVSDRAWRGARPWVPPVPRPRGEPTEEPPAAVE